MEQNVPPKNTLSQKTKKKDTHEIKISMYCTDLFLKAIMKKYFPKSNNWQKETFIMENVLQFE